MASLLLVGTALLVAALLAAAVGFAARRRWRQAGMAGLALAVVTIAYGATLLAVSAFTPVRNMAIGEWKCFDEWCATVTSATRIGDDVEVELAVHNRGQREQAPDTPRIWLLTHGHREELAVPELTSRIPGGSTRQLPPVRVLAPNAEIPQLLLTEGGLPSILVIGDDNSPLHPQPAWPLP